MPDMGSGGPKLSRDIVPMQLAIVETISRVYGNPLAAPNRVCYDWARDLELRRGGETVLYTGCLYQLMAYAGSFVDMYERLGDTGLRVARFFSQTFPKLFSRLASRFVRPDVKVLGYSSRTLRSIAKLLKDSGVDFGYLYEKDTYSGIYLYELGLEEAFTQHAMGVYRGLVESGVKRIITVDPHTTYVLREIYPRYIENFNIEVKHYLELITVGGGVSSGESLTAIAGNKPPVIHDSCYMVRKLGLYNATRKAAKNIRYIEPKNSGAGTLCCGGPIEGISPKLALNIAVRRARELASTGSNSVIVMCPICYTNLSRAFDMLGLKNISIKDLAEEIRGNG